VLLVIDGPARLREVESLSTGLLLLFVATATGLYIWSMVIFLKSVSEIQQLPMRQTMASAVLPVFLVAMSIALLLWQLELHGVEPAPNPVLGYI
jgi:hypothetical protein